MKKLLGIAALMLAFTPLVQAHDRGSMERHDHYHHHFHHDHYRHHAWHHHYR